MKKKTEKALKAGPDLDSKLLSLVINNLKDHAVFALDLGGHITTWNIGAERILRYKTKEILGKHFSIFFTPEGRQIHMPERELNKALVFGKSEDDRWHVRKDGTLFWASGTITPMREGAGPVFGFVKILRDATSYKLATEKLKENNEILEERAADIARSRARTEYEKAKDDALLDSIGEGVMATDEKFKITFLNQQAAKMFGIEKEAAQGKPFFKIFKILDQNGKKIKYQKSAVATVLKTGKKNMGSLFHYVAGSGERFPAVTTTAPINFNGKTVGTITVFRDNRKEIEISKIKSEFVSLVSHQLRTPLTAIKLFVEMLTIDGMATFTPEQIENIKNIDESNEKMIALVNDLLNISRMETGRMEIIPRQTKLIPFIKEVVEEIKQVDGRKAKITLDSKIRDVSVGIDQNMFRQVVINLISNAIEYSPGKKEVIISITKTDSHCILSFKDQGMGISKEDQTRIFEKYFRSAGAIKRRTEGSGLGLYMSKMIIERHGGKITLDSLSGVGSTFHIHLPVGHSVQKK